MKQYLIFSVLSLATATSGFASGGNVCSTPAQQKSYCLSQIAKGLPSALANTCLSQCLSHFRGGKETQCDGFQVHSKSSVDLFSVSNSLGDLGDMSRSLSFNCSTKSVSLDYVGSLGSYEYKEISYPNDFFPRRNYALVSSATGPENLEITVDRDQVQMFVNGSVQIFPAHGVDPDQIEDQWVSDVQALNEKFSQTGDDSLASKLDLTKSPFSMDSSVSWGFTVKVNKEEETVVDDVREFSVLGENGADAVSDLGLAVGSYKATQKDIVEVFNFVAQQVRAQESSKTAAVYIWEEIFSKFHPDTKPNPEYPKTISILK